MGKAISRINPKIISRTQRTFLVEAVQFILSMVMLLPERKHNKRGIKPYDYRIIFALCLIRVLFRKTYSDYEIETRKDPRICFLFGMKILPGKSTLQAHMNLISMTNLWRFNSIILAEWSKRKINLLIDSSGIRIIGRSIWFSIRVKRFISKKECDKTHLAVCTDVLFIMNWRITNRKRNDSPLFAVLLRQFKWLGIVIADKGYTSRKNFQLAADKRGCAFFPFKKGATASPKSHPAWKAAFWIWGNLNSLYQGIYHQRSKIESVFHALKERYGDKLFAKGAIRRRKEMALRFIAYNVRLIIFYRYAMENNLDLWVKA
ncbi:MAG: transposase [Nanoarchaeota archaeon]